MDIKAQDIRTGDIYRDENRRTQDGRKVLRVSEPFTNPSGHIRIPVLLEDAATGNHGEIFLAPGQTVTVDRAAGTKQATPAKTPTVAIARVLRSLGLVQGRDFRVRGKYQGHGADRERIGTHVAVLSQVADKVIADNADRIEQEAGQAGFSFRVSVYYTDGGGMWTWVANYGARVREARPQAPVYNVPSAPSPSAREDAIDAAEGRKYLKPRTKAREAASRAMPKLVPGKPRPAFPQPTVHQ